MERYVCIALEQGQCVEWVVQQDLLEVLAITPSQAIEISVAMVTVFIVAFFIGEIGHMIKAKYW